MANKTLPIGSRVRLEGITDQEDLDLNGRAGRIVPKHRFRARSIDHAFGEIGVALDSKGPFPEPVNVLWSEVVEAQQ